MNGIPEDTESKLIKQEFDPHPAGPELASVEI
jgi:hypothetical protein